MSGRNLRAMKRPTWLQILVGSINIVLAGLLGGFLGCSAGIFIPGNFGVPGEWVAAFGFGGLVVGAIVAVTVVRWEMRRRSIGDPKEPPSEPPTDSPAGTPTDPDA